MEVSEILDIVRIKLADPLSADGSDLISLFKTNELIYYINNALREAVFRGKLLVKQSYSINLTATNSEYPVPFGAVNVIECLDENKRPITKVHEVDLQQNTNSGCCNTLNKNDWRKDTDELPYHFMQNTINNKIVFYPIPSRDSTVTLRATYIPDVLDISDDIPVQLSQIYQPDLIYWVLFEAFDKKDAETYEPGKAEENKQRFEDIFGEKLSAELFMEMLQYPDDPGSLRNY